MRNFEIIREGVSIAALRQQIEAQPHLWDQHTVRKTAPGTPHGRMSDIWVRYNDAAPFEASGDFRRFNDPHIPIWYLAWRALPALQPIVFDLMAKVQGIMLGGVLITRIPDGEGIAWHADKGWHVEYFDKFYLSIQSAPGAAFLCEDEDGIEELQPSPGDIWRFDNRKPHAVSNASGEDRVTAIICIRTDMFQEHAL